MEEQMIHLTEKTITDFSTEMMKSVNKRVEDYIDHRVDKTLTEIEEALKKI